MFFVQSEPWIQMTRGHYTSLDSVNLFYNASQN